MNAKTAKITDYIYCEDCQEFVDFWKYNHNIIDAGHNGCSWRYVTKEELADCIEACRDGGCFDEEFIGPVLIVKRPEDSNGNIVEAS
jgi:hypothetical protein